MKLVSASLAVSRFAIAVAVLPQLALAEGCMEMEGVGMPSVRMGVERKIEYGDVGAVGAGVIKTRHDVRR